MKLERIVLLVLAILVALGAGGLIGLSRASLMPPVQKVEQAIPDDHIPR